MSVKILIDSSSDISQEEAKELNISVIPMEITFEDEQFFDGIDLMPNEFYNKLENNSVLPKTSQINAFRWENEFSKHTKNGDEVVAITISSKLSGTYNSAIQAAEKFKNKVFVVDSLNACIGERMICEYAIRLAKENKSAKEIAEALENKKSKVRVMAMIGTLEYLKKGGRISSAVAFAGTLLSLKPLISVVDGEIKMIGKAMGTKKALISLNKLIAEHNIDFEMPFGSLWSGIESTSLETYLKTNSPFAGVDINNISKHILGATIATHIGPGAVGVSYFEK